MMSSTQLSNARVIRVRSTGALVILNVPYEIAISCSLSAITVLPCCEVPQYVQESAKECACTILMT
jgi:hypothetical protein